MKRYPIRIRRAASYVEEVDAIIVAKSKDDAERIAAGLGDGQMPNWPDIDRFNTVSRSPVSHELMEIEHGA